MAWRFSREGGCRIYVVRCQHLLFAFDANASTCLELPERSPQQIRSVLKRRFWMTRTVDDLNATFRCPLLLNARDLSVARDLAPTSS